ncbi:MAG: type II CRISPR-associated endonuclease Cas1 [Paludibacteraceae bacterium]|nr:type II CRISPR-associated endonuclease Cas1 [Paludibacteraceae bacterium]
MLKQTLFFSNPCKLSLQLKQLVIEREDLPQPITRPIEDLSVVIIENQQVVVTIPLLNELAKNNVSVIFCNSHYMPSIQLIPLDANSTQQESYKYQLAATLPTTKRIWKEIIEAKIHNQALLLDSLSKNGLRLKPLYNNVKSGDVDNNEGVAARLYWHELFGDDFLRDRYGLPPNDLLNYGYTILRAATARALVGSGLNLAFGLFHRNKYNAFPLADDIMEAYRPYVDDIVFRLWEIDNKIRINKETKSELINIMYRDVLISNKKHPLQIALTMTSASLLRIFRGEDKHLLLPIYSP